MSTEDQIELACSNNDDDHIFVDNGSSRRGAIMNDYVAMESTDTDTITTNNIQHHIVDDSVVASPWFSKLEEVSLPEFHGGIVVPPDESQWSLFQILKSYLGPGVLVAVGYMDPGNWSTDIAGGSQFGYQLLFVILLSSLMAMFLQHLSLKAGLATGRDLAQIIRDSYPKPVVYILWIIIEIAICATDIAEVLGSAIALNLLFNCPLIAGCCVTAVDVLILLMINGNKFRLLEGIVACLILIITLSFAIQLGLSKPIAGPLFRGFLPNANLINDKEMLYNAIGILGATVMPHNLFLHSSIVLTRKIERTEVNVRRAILFSTIDSNISLSFALFVNAAILMVAAAAFNTAGYDSVADLSNAYELLTPLLHSTAAPILFGIALLAAGQNATLTGTLTGQIVMEGFTKWTVSPFVRRFITRCLAIIPAVCAVAIGGERSANDLLILSQVILGYALPFAVVPLIHVTYSKARMGSFVNSLPSQVLAILIALLIISMNIILLL